MSQTLTTTAELARAGLIPPDQVGPLHEVAERYAVSVTPEIAGLIDRSDPRDPIALQFIPTTDELLTSPGQRGDPIGDERHTPVPGIVHRYPDRVLLKLTLLCPVYCRFCFRREMVGPGNGQMLSAAETDAALDYIAAHPAIWEVILTGGDPLMLSARRIAEVTRQLSIIPHLRVIRWHTRVPVAAPSRVTAAMIRAMKSSKATYLVVHVNHVAELSPAALASIAALVDAGIPVLSQSVLLKGVNDNLPALESLMRGLVAARVKPYYLHHMDLAPGTEHFRITLAEGRQLMAGLRRAASGLAVPQYVLDIPGGYAKAQVAESDLDEGPDGIRLRDAAGEWHDYRES